MTLRAIICAYCGNGAMKHNSAIGRSERIGAPLYCDRACAGKARRVCLPESVRKAEKADYDRRRRAELGEALREAKRLAYRAAVAANPERVRTAQKANREARKQQHLEYCRRPEYRKWKADYDRKYRSRKEFGDFGEAAILLNDLIAEINARITRTEIYRQNGTLNKWITRRRQYDQAVGS